MSRLLAALRQNPQWFTKQADGMVMSAILRSPADASEREILDETIKACSESESAADALLVIGSFCSIPAFFMHPSIAAGILGGSMLCSGLRYHEMHEIKYTLKTIHLDAESRVVSD